METQATLAATDTLVMGESQRLDCSYFRHKWSFDCLLAAILLIPCLPLIGVLVLVIRLHSRGPGIFRQVRVGKNGREYVMYKLRSMNLDAEARTGAVWSTSNDPRVTRLGRFLRRSHLDELPQLFNVLRGEMSLIGPRPERPEIVEVLVGLVPGYLDRLNVLPGITGLAQLNLPPDSDLYSVRRKLVLDVQYIAEASLFFDLRILACTALRLIGCPGNVAIRLTRLYREAALPKGVNGHKVDLGLLCPQDSAAGNDSETEIADQLHGPAAQTDCVRDPHPINRIAVKQTAKPHWQVKAR